MRNRSSLLLAASAFVIVSMHAVMSAQAPAPRTVWDGAYTDAQAARAEGVFNANCARCHQLAAEGARPLVGDAFLQKHTQKSVGELLTYISTSMPNGANAGTLPASNYNDLMALILKSNGLPAGTVEVSPESVAKVMIVPKGGAGELPNNTMVRFVGCLAPKAGADWTVVNAAPPQRAEKAGAVAADAATQALGDKTFALKFVLSRLDPHVGKRVAVTGLLIGAGGVNGINVNTVAAVADTCP
jgi:S-disulfanyl-L-cysteine oxidoreductase SoxD